MSLRRIVLAFAAFGFVFFVFGGVLVSLSHEVCSQDIPRQKKPLNPNAHVTDCILEEAPFTYAHDAGLILLSIGSGFILSALIAFGVYRMDEDHNNEIQSKSPSRSIL